MPNSWRFAEEFLDLGGGNSISGADASRQAQTAREIIRRLNLQPGVVLADEVGMGKTFVALAVACSVLLSTKAREPRPVVVMVPPGLVSKWRRDWEYFRSLCVKSGSSLDGITVAEVRSATDLFRVLGSPDDRRARLILMSTTAFSGALRDRWIQLAMVRLAKGTTRLNYESRKRLEKWAASLVQLKSQKALTPALIGRLMSASLKDWQAILVQNRLLEAGSVDRIPQLLEKCKDQLDWSPIVNVLQNALPGRSSEHSGSRVREAVRSLTDACQSVYRQWLGTVNWRSPLLVLDEAHHAKNDSTRVAQLFRGGAKPTLEDKFDRLLLLTATPFQLGHNELTRVLRTFASAHWSGAHAPTQGRDVFHSDLNELERRLDTNRLAARALDRAWGRLTPSMIADRNGVSVEEIQDEDSVNRWFGNAQMANQSGHATPVEREVLLAFDRCVEARLAAQSCADRPWVGLQTWVIRHNRPNVLVHAVGASESIPRRRVLPGRAIEQTEGVAAATAGLGFGDSEALAFLLAARAQGEMASQPKSQSLKFAEGLCSSYEAFHHTRRTTASVIDDEPSKPIASSPVTRDRTSLVPLSWYADRIAEHVPGALGTDERLRLHPKLRVVVERAVDLWERGEKTLIFCFYVQTSRALAEHIEAALNQRIRELARRGTDAPTEVAGMATIRRIAERIGDPRSPFYAAVRDELQAVLAEPAWSNLSSAVREQSLGLLLAYARSVPFLVRVLPLTDPQIRRALESNQRDRKAIAAARAALQHALRAPVAGEQLSLVRQAKEFLKFASELSMHTVATQANELEAGELTNPLEDYLRAISVYSERTTHGEESGYRTVFRAEKPVRLVNGSTPMETRDRVMLAFNSPMFPEILVSSKVLAEGVDLHRFCRHVIHHDLDWNPSMIEQRTGRLDRIRCRAEAVLKPIMVYEPFIAGSADERMYRVVKDRERWFQIVMGQKYEFDEGMAEDISERVPLPQALSKELVFNLAVV